MNYEETLSRFSLQPLEQNQLHSEKTVFLRQENQCCVCGAGLSTQIEYIPFTRFMVEKAKCNDCNTLNRVKNHSLQ